MEVLLEVEIGMGKTGRRAYGLDDIAIVPSRRTRDPEDVETSWQLGPFKFELPFIASAMDSVVNPDVAIAVGKLGGLGALNLEGIQTRYEDPGPVLEEIASFPKEVATRGIQRIYEEPVKPELIQKRVEQIKAVSYTHLRAHETRHDLVCRLLLEKKKKNRNQNLHQHHKK